MKHERDGSRFFPFFCPCVVGFCLALSGCISVTGAYIPDQMLSNGWYENTSLRNTVSQFLGMEQVMSVTYEFPGDFPASLSVMTLKSLVLLDEDDLQNKTRTAIFSSLKQGIELNTTTLQTGERYVLQAHISMFFEYRGKDTSLVPEEDVYVIGEVWNCQSSGTSVICIGLAYITHHTSNTTMVSNTSAWEKIVMDEIGSVDSITGLDGLITHVKCH